jgi:hypothetical protein
MNRPLKWLCQLLASILILIVVAWTWEDGAQWLLRSRAEKLLTEVKSVELNRSTNVDIQALITRWSRYGTHWGRCTDKDGYCVIQLAHVYPDPLRGYLDEGVRNWLPRVMDHTGLRTSAVRAGFNFQNGVVTSKGFSEYTSLPLRNWFSLGGAYVPELAVSSSEVSKFRDSYVPAASHPYRRARYMKGPYGLEISFLPQENPSEKAALMEFRFSCITRFVPCESEGEILPEGWKMLQEP